MCHHRDHEGPKTFEATGTGLANWRTTGLPLATGPTPELEPLEPLPPKLRLSKKKNHRKVSNHFRTKTASRTRMSLGPSSEHRTTEQRDHHRNHKHYFKLAERRPNQRITSRISGPATKPWGPPPEPDVHLKNLEDCLQNMRTASRITDHLQSSFFEGLPPEPQTT